MSRTGSNGRGRAGVFAYGGLLAVALSLGGCLGPSSPSLAAFGAYFPSWLFCTLVGVIGAVVVRGVFIKLGLDETLPWRLLVYTCVAAIIGFVLALSVYGR